MTNRNTNIKINSLDTKIQSRKKSCIRNNRKYVKRNWTKLKYADKV